MKSTAMSDWMVRAAEEGVRAQSLDSKRAFESWLSPSKNMVILTCKIMTTVNRTYCMSVEITCLPIILVNVLVK